jgi:hypothetical protein
MRHARQVRAPPVHRAQLNLRIIGKLADNPLHHGVQQLIAIPDIPV